MLMIICFTSLWLAVSDADRLLRPERLQATSQQQKQKPRFRESRLLRSETCALNQGCFTRARASPAPLLPKKKPAKAKQLNRKVRIRTLVWLPVCCRVWASVNPANVLTRAVSRWGGDAEVRRRMTPEPIRLAEFS